jgi:aminopeptidase-like protein
MIITINISLIMKVREVGKKKVILEKNWLMEVAKTVERNAKMYNNQLKVCEQKLNKKGFFGIF